VPSLHLSGLDERHYFSARSLARARSYARGLDALWIAGTVLRLGALALLAWRPPRRGAILVGLALLVTLFLASLPVGIAALWWQHHWGLGPFDVGSWLVGQWSTLLAEGLAGLAAVVLVVALARRVARWWLVAAPVVVAVVALFTFVSGWLDAIGTQPLRDPHLAAEVTRLERIEHVPGTPVTVQDVSSQTSQVDAFTTGFGPSAHVVVWNTLLDGRFTRREVAVVLGHELGHVRSRHVLKAIGWSALAAFPALWLLAFLTRRRSLAEPANVPFAALVLSLLLVLALPLVNLVSRRYEAQADWRGIGATRDPAAAVGLFQGFERTSLEDPDPGLLDYLWLEDHPTLMQRIAMARAWELRDGRPSRGGPGSP